MTSIHRERVLTAMNHERPDRVPLFYRDVPEVEERLLRDLNMKSRDDLLEYLDIDFRWVGPEYVGPALDDAATGLRRDIWGVEYKYVNFSETSGYWEVVGNPLAKCNDPAELDNYPWPKLEWFDFSTLAAQVAAYDDYAIMTNPSFSSPSILQSPIQTLLGDEKAFMDIVLNPELFEAMIKYILDFQLPFIDKMLGAAGGRIDFFRIGDDFGTQRNLLMSPEQWRTSIQPALKAMADVAKQHGAYYYHHSCGAIRKLIPDLIETGVDVLDPVQVKADGMVPAELKAEFGDKVCFSGGVDEQDLLPNGTPEQVKEGVLSLLDDMACDGGFFVGPTHNFQDDIPTENIVAMYDAAKAWR